MKVTNSYNQIRRDLTIDLKQERKKRYFPCPVCKGQGGWDEWGWGWGCEWDECGYCEGDALIEIGGEIHKKNSYESIALKILDVSVKIGIDNGKSEYTLEELWEIGKKALEIIEEEEGGDEK